MTDAAIRPAELGSLAAHPLDPADGAEFLAGRQILADAGLLGDTARFAYYGREEPPKDEVLAGPPDGRPTRRLRAFLIDVATGESADVVVSLDENRVVSHRVLDPPSDGQVPIISEDFAVVEEVVRADPGWRAAMARRGLADVTKIRACPQTAGKFDEGDDERRRFVRVLAFRQEREHDYVWAHPVDGIAAYVDLIERKVFRIVDEFERPVPDESGDYDDPAGGAELHARRSPAALAGLVDAGGLRRARGPGPAPDQPGRRRGDPAARLPGVHPRTGRAVRRPAVPVLAGVLRLRRVPAREVDQLAGARLRLPG